MLRRRWFTASRQDARGIGTNPDQADRPPDSPAGYWRGVRNGEHRSNPHYVCNSLGANRGKCYLALLGVTRRDRVLQSVTRVREEMDGMDGMDRMKSEEAKKREVEISGSKWK